MKKKKGELLIETIVAMMVSLLIMSCVFSTISSFVNLNRKEKEYVKAESICLDIDKYYDLYGSEWARIYYGNLYEKDPDENGVYVQKYNNKFLETTKDDVKACYEVQYKQDENGLVVNVIDTKNNRRIIKDLEYGESALAITPEDYYGDIENNEGKFTFEEVEFDDSHSGGGSGSGEGSDTPGGGTDSSSSEGSETQEGESTEAGETTGETENPASEESAEEETPEEHSEEVTGETNEE